MEPPSKLGSMFLDAYLDCPTKGFLQGKGQAAESCNAYAVWHRQKADAYKEVCVRLLSSEMPGEIISGVDLTSLAARDDWAIASHVAVEYAGIRSVVHGLSLEVPNKDDGKKAFRIYRFSPAPSISQKDRLLLAFEAKAITAILDAETKATVIYGEEHRKGNVNLSMQAAAQRTLLRHIQEFRDQGVEPEVILNKHCPVCEFRDLCWNRAIEADDLSLLKAMSLQERARHNKRGIFTIHQLSFTFRPRRTPKRAKNPRKPRYLALQARALREQTVYFHGTPAIPEKESSIYIDIEGVPDANAYYLIGALFHTPKSKFFRSYWANKIEEMAGCVERFLAEVAALPNAQLFHYGDYETTAMKRLKPFLSEGSRLLLDKALPSAINVLSIIHSHVYFPTYSNSLKDVERIVGYQRFHPHFGGLDAIVARDKWETTQDAAAKVLIIEHNLDDCLALERVVCFLKQFSRERPTESACADYPVSASSTEEIKTTKQDRLIFKTRKFVVDDLSHVSRCAYFDYQRQRLFLRSSAANKRERPARKNVGNNLPVNAIVETDHPQCPECGKKRLGPPSSRTINRVIDLKFAKLGVKRWISDILVDRFECPRCKARFRSDNRKHRIKKYGWNLASWCLYLNFSIGVQMRRVSRCLEEMFRIPMEACQLYRFREEAVSFYGALYVEIRDSIIAGSLAHIDETTVKLRGTTGYVWVLANFRFAYYFYRPSREGGFLHEMLSTFKGTLVSDFFTAYDSLPCNQQKCIVHFIREIDDDILRNPLDGELIELAQRLGQLLRTILGDVDRFGLKRRHLWKHRDSAERYLAWVEQNTFRSEIAAGYQKRLKKSGWKMFTFLGCDGVPWNNNNAEHAIKRFAKIRRFSDGTFTERSVKTCLVMSTILETCALNELSPLAFLLSKVNTLSGFQEACRRQARKRRCSEDIVKMVEPDASEDFAG